ncbi:MAG: rRNA maturation RNase YbeY [Magnetococcales bacterium]|nr:rRNA maturation RNase YbeY [Magnetococcales bacterium]
MPATVLVNLSSPQWPAVEERVSQAVLATLEAENYQIHRDVQPLKITDDIEVGVLLTDDAESRQLNLTHRGLDRPANVLSFAMEDGEEFPEVEGDTLLLGDIVIPFETTRAEAMELGIPLESRLIHLVVHGVLHLLGFDHERSPEEAEQQEKQEIIILAKLGLADPYG